MGGVAVDAGFLRWATLLLCTKLGLPPDVSPAALRPFGEKAWNALLWRLSDLPEPGDFLLTASEDKLMTRLPVADALRVASLRRGRRLAQELEALRTRGIEVLTAGDGGLVRCGLHEPVAYAYGARDLLEALPRQGVAIVGARDAGEEALKLARKLGVACAERGRIVVSGGADGIDSAAQCAALNVGGGVVFVLPYGLDTRAAWSLIEGLTGRYLLLSAAHPAAPFSAAQAMQRNRALYAMASVAAVIGAKEGRGGTWAGAIEALRGGQTPVMVFEGFGAGDAALCEAGARSVSGTAGIEAVVAWVTACGREGERDERIETSEWV